MSCRNAVSKFDMTMKTMHSDDEYQSLVAMYSKLLFELVNKVEKGENSIELLTEKVNNHEKRIKALEDDNKILFSNQERFSAIESYIKSISEGLCPIESVKFVAMTESGEATFFSSIESLARYFQKPVETIKQYLASGKPISSDGENFKLIRTKKVLAKRT